MKIYLHNQIDLDGEKELIVQEFPVELTRKKDIFYLVYINDDKEKVVLKFNHNELVMTRFSEPASIMRFLKDKQILVSIHTPIGIQQLLTDTHYYELDEEQQQVEVHYQLKTADQEQVFASYKLVITWV